VNAFTSLKVPLTTLTPLLVNSSKTFIFSALGGLSVSLNAAMRRNSSFLCTNSAMRNFQNPPVGPSTRTEVKVAIDSGPYQIVILVVCGNLLLEQIKIRAQEASILGN
jgi:hypothetical protein